MGELHDNTHVRPPLPPFDVKKHRKRREERLPKTVYTFQSSGTPRAVRSRQENVRIRLSAEEKWDLQQNARRAGYGPRQISEYARRVMFGDIPVVPVQSKDKGRDSDFVFKVNAKEAALLDRMVAESGESKSDYVRNHLLGVLDV